MRGGSQTEHFKLETDFIPTSKSERRELSYMCNLQAHKMDEQEQVPLIFFGGRFFFASLSFVPV